MVNFLNETYFYNSIKVWIYSFLIMFFVFFALKNTIKIFYKKLKNLHKKTKTTLDDYIIIFLSNIKTPTLFIISVNVGLTRLNLSSKITHIAGILLIFTLIIQVGILLNQAIKIFVPIYMGEDDPAKTSAIELITVICQSVLWVLIAILILDTSGVNITALVTGLGIGGVAVALAVRNILGDLLSSFSIILDKPFKVGDFISVNDLMGNVKKIGIKTTRIKAVGGEEIIFSNEDILKSRIKNVKKLKERTIVFNIGVTYETSYENLTKVSKIIEEAIKKEEPNVRFSRCHFNSYESSYINFQTLYYIKSPDYLLYMDIQQRINLFIYKEFKKHKIEFAYPTRTIITKKT